MITKTRYKCIHTMDMYRVTVCIFRYNITWGLFSYWMVNPLVINASTQNFQRVAESQRETKTELFDAPKVNENVIENAARTS